MPVRAHMRRVFDITVCSRPFRAAGPRLNTEMLGDTLVVHNYGHGGSGWSLSWGSAQIVLEKALARGDKNLAVIGCGALGHPDGCDFHWDQWLIPRAFNAVWNADC